MTVTEHFPALPATPEELDQPFHIMFSPESMQRLRRIAFDDSHLDPVAAMLARAQMAASERNFGQARQLVLAAFVADNDRWRTDDGRFAEFLTAALVTYQLNWLSALLATRWGLAAQTDVRVAQDGPGLMRLRWRLLSRSHAEFAFDASVFEDKWTWRQAEYFTWTFHAIAEFMRSISLEQGELILNFSDEGISPGLAYSDYRPGFFLIPDFWFLRTAGYRNIRHHYLAHRRRWSERVQVAFWRGATTGYQPDPKVGWRSLPRVLLCKICQEQPNLFDVGLSSVMHISDPNLVKEVRDSGLMRGYVPAKEFDRWKYQIDIDGFTNSWPGLFQKLLSGAAVLKVTSARGFRQWYYDRLKPWVNSVPVGSNMHDLIDKVRWLRAHDDAARQIGERGAALAETLDFESQLKDSSRIITAAFQYFSARPEIIIRFGASALHKERGLRLDAGMGDST
jgi:hypothetical protein